MVALKQQQKTLDQFAKIYRTIYYCQTEDLIEKLYIMFITMFITNVYSGADSSVTITFMLFTTIIFPARIY